MSKLLLVLFVISLLPVVIMSFLSYSQARDAIYKRTINHLLSINQLKKMEIENWIHVNCTTLEILSGNPFLINEFTRYIRVKDHKENADLEYVSIPFVKCLMPVVNAGHFLEIFILDKDTGQVLISTDSRQERKYLDNRPFFLKGKEGTFVSSVNYSMTLREPAMNISTPLKDHHGQLIAILGGRVNLSPLSKIMESTSELSQSLDTYLVNSFNFFVTEPRFGDHYALRKSVHTKGVDLAMAQKSGVDFYNDYRDVPVIGAYEWIPEREFCLMTEIDQQEAFEPILTLKRNTMGLGAVVCFALILVSWASSRGLKHSLDRLIRCTQEIGRGNLDFKADIRTKDEIGELSDAFVLMAGQLKDTLVSKHDLEKEVEERKKVNFELQEALRELGQSNKSLEQFAYVASHDLQEPLRMVSSYTQLLQERYDSLLDEKGKKYIYYAVDGAARMQKLINDLLDFSRVTTRGQPFNITSSQEALDMALLNLSSAIIESGATVANDPLPQVKADKTQMALLFQNLISNAIKFRGQDSPRIEVSAEEDGHFWRFTVKDNGIGIDSTYKDKIFIIFQRLHTRQEYPGTGIGLAICKRIVERHGGNIWFESAIGKGTVFYFTIEKGELIDAQEK
ncbi:MAG: HAMP domain-containing protein [Proteobacteria bacterium]|nr:HAMP domain-containing protein [Pseudomonadota bacterium]